MNDHNLDDLIIDTIEPKSNKAKSFLTIIALIIVALIVGILFIKTMENSPKNTNIGLEENTSDLISPELTLQSTPETKVPKHKTELSSLIEEKVNSSVKTEEIKKETVKIEKTNPVSKAPKAVEQTIIQTPHTEEKVIVPQSTYHEKTLPKEKSVKTEITQKVVVPKTKHTVTKIQYYIQVGSFSQTPSSRFLNTIKKHGFTYKITAPTSNGTKKLLIGPYPSRAAADNALIRVKDRINKGAFIVKR